MLIRVIVLLLLTCVMGTYFSRDFAMASYELNQKYIAEKLCENKARPWMHCNGRCYLMNKVKQAEENEKKQESKDLRNSFQITWFVQTAPLQQRDTIDADIARRFVTHYAYAYNNQYNASIFRPPKSLRLT